MHTPIMEIGVLSLLRDHRVSRLMTSLTEDRLQRRCSKSKTIKAGKAVYVKLLDLLMDAGYFSKVNVDPVRLYNMLLEKENIVDAMAPVSQGLKMSTHLGDALFYLVIGWISSELQLSDIDHYDIVTCYSLAPSDEGIMAQIIRNMVLMVIDNAVLRLRATECPDEFDYDLQFMLQNGSASSIYGRLKMLVTCGTVLYNGNVNDVVVRTLAMELPRLSRSRQIVFTRVLKHITDGIVGIGSSKSVHLSQRYNSELWRLLVAGINKSGIVELRYDSIDLVRALERLNQNYDISRLCRILSHDNRSYVGDHSDFQRNRDMVGALYAMRKYNIQFDFPNTFNYIEGTSGSVLLDRLAL